MACCLCGAKPLSEPMPVLQKKFHGSSDICPMGFIYPIQIKKSLIRHLGLAFGNVRHVRWFLWTLKCWNIVNWTLRNKLQWNFNRNTYIFIKENASENVIWKMVAILSRPQCVKDHGISKGPIFSPVWLSSDLILSRSFSKCPIAAKDEVNSAVKFFLFWRRSAFSWENVSSDPYLTL